jgi:hypothetical protein
LFYQPYFQEEVERFYRAAEKIEQSLGLDPNNTAWALISDNPEVIDLVIKGRYGWKVLWYPGEARHMDKVFTVDGYERSLLEWCIMSEVPGHPSWT